MNRIVFTSLVSASLFFPQGLALAQSPPRDAGAAEDQAFSLGPGGGDPDAGDGKPPFESTGLEDSVAGSCGCRAAGGSVASGSGTLAVALLAGAVYFRRCRLRSKPGSRPRAP